jgi:polysaccharide pyruvyl transferase WcaK-like protein
MGDEAMIDALGERLHELGSSTYLLAPQPESGWSTKPYDRVADLASHTTRGGFLIRMSSPLSNPLNAARTIVVGADGIDGAYGVRGVSQRVSSLNTAVAAGRKAVLANFSFRQSVPNWSKKLLRQLDPAVEVWARDKNSQTRASTALDREVGVFPDIAMFLKPTPLPDPLFAVAELHRGRESGFPIAALVVNGHLASTDRSMASVAQYFADLTEGLLSIGAVVGLLAHDKRVVPGDRELVSAIKTVLKERHVPNEKVVAITPETAADAKAFLAASDLCLTARMHAAVASLSAGTPTIGLDYVDKFAGQFEWYGQSTLVVTSDPRGTSEALRLSEDVLRNAERIREELALANAHLREVGIPWIS